ncbi:arginase family protein [Actinomadura oligospora]|uniref:arginase family protein n=1 Tax=Actinomadura oligospora TaxID=111804 RepID=UPI0004787EF3|nr:arginase family protein [Actinomadura oligospora]
MFTVIEVPQWQGSSAPSAPKLAEGAARLASLISDGAASRVRVTPGESLAETASRVRAVLPPDGLTVTIGGDCGVELEPIAAAARRFGERLAVVWFDAHGDLNTPESSPSGAFHGMVLRTLLGEGPAELLPPVPLRPSQIVLSGVRALDPAERDYVQNHPFGDAETLPEDALLYLHLDLDVLDGFSSIGCPEPGGLTPNNLLSQVKALSTRHHVIGLGITEYTPSDPADETLLTDLAPKIVRLCATSHTR